MTIVAAIDCGTNTIKLLIGIHTDTGLEVLVRESRMVRLGQGVDATGRLAEEALVRAFDAIDAYADLITSTASSRSGSAPRRRPATPATRRSSAPACSPGSGSSRRC